MARKIDPNSPDRQPGFWPDEDACNNPTPMAKAIQMPLADPNWQNRVLAAYTLSTRKSTAK